MSLSVEGSLGTWETRSIVVTMMPILVALSVLQMGSGYVLESLEETYLRNPTLLVMVPVMIGMGGNLGAIMSSRLSTRLHLGMLSFEPRDRDLWINAVAILWLAVTVFTILGVLTYAFGVLVFQHPIGFIDVMTISLVSGMSLAVLAIVISIGSTWASYRLGFDPDDTTIPVVTNVCDILGVLILSAVAIAVV